MARRLRAVDLDEFASLYDEPGPFVSVYLGVGEDAWRQAQIVLAAAGASDAAVRPIEDVLSDLGPDAQGIAVVSTDAGVLHFETWESPPRPIAVWAELPALVPLLAHRQRHIPHVVAVMHPSHVDLLAVSERHIELDLLNGSAGPAPLRVHARRLPITLERRPNPTPKDAVTSTVGRIETLAGEVGAQAIFLGGDQLGVQSVREALGEELADLIRLPPSGERRSMVPFMDECLEELHEAEQAAVRAAFAQAREQEMAIEGVGDVVSAVESGEAATVVVDEEATIEAREPGRSTPPDVVVAAAAHRGVGLRVVDGLSLRQGVGALLRVPRIDRGRGDSA